MPADSLLVERVRRYRVEVADGAVTATPMGTFGDVEGAGVLRVVESVHADLVHDRLLLAEEQEGASTLKAYWIATDQGDEVDTFHVFDRATLGRLGSFRGRGVLNTEGSR